MDVISIIKNIPSILVLVVPGYVGYLVFTALTNYKLGSNVLIASCVFSFLSLSVVKLVIISGNVFADTLMSTLLCVVVSIIASTVVRNQSFRTFLVNHFKTSLAAGPWEDSLDYETGSRIRLQFKKDFHIPVIIGNVYSIGDITNNPWIALSYYSFFESVYDEKPYYTENTGKHIFLVNINDIESAELWSHS